MSLKYPYNYILQSNDKIIPMKVNYKQKIGKWGETIAEAYLCEKGFNIVDRNARTPYGELDLIANKGNDIVFIEVKTRTNTTYGLPEEAIDDRKQDHIQKAIHFYMQNHPDLAGDWRIDVISILGRPNDSPPQIVWFENALK